MKDTTSSTADELQQAAEDDVGGIERPEREDDAYQARDKALKLPPIRMLVSSSEASAIIGKAGSNIEGIKQEFQVRVTITKPKIQKPFNFSAASSQTAPAAASVISMERVALVQGSDQPSCVQACVRIAFDAFHGNPLSLDSGGSTASHASLYAMPVLRLLVPISAIGGIIGKGGDRIRNIMAESGAKVVISSNTMPSSTERVVEILAPSPLEMTACLDQVITIFASTPQASSNVYFDPKNSSPIPGSHFSYTSSLNKPSSTHSSPASSYASGTKTGRATPSSLPSTPSKSPSRRTQSASPRAPSTLLVISARSAGGLIGKSGVKISEIRQMTGSRIHVRPLIQGSLTREVVVSGPNEESVNNAVGFIKSVCEEEEARLDQLASEEALDADGAGVEGVDEKEERIALPDRLEA
ncbi:Poly(rC)-binding protein 3 [Kappamyces sp. JEL0829]|nr:Poly(rC)-binding protein 3 [Kappamyces sp. JEL0829]